VGPRAKYRWHHGAIPQELSAVGRTITERAKAKLRGEIVDEGQRTRYRDTVERWAKAEGADLENEAE